MTYDLDLWPTGLNMDHLLIKDYLPTKFEASEAGHSWVISCTSYGQSTWPLTLTFDLLTWISIGIIYSSRTIYRTYQVWSFWGRTFLSYQLHKLWTINMTFDLDLWPTDLNINRDHLLIKDYLPYLPSLKLLGHSGAKYSRVISCTRLRETDIPTMTDGRRLSAIYTLYNHKTGELNWRQVLHSHWIEHGNVNKVGSNQMGD